MDSVGRVSISASCPFDVSLSSVFFFLCLFSARWRQVSSAAPKCQVNTTHFWSGKGKMQIRFPLAPGMPDGDQHISSSDGEAFCQVWPVIKRACESCFLVNFDNLLPSRSGFHVFPSVVSLKGGRPQSLIPVFFVKISKSNIYRHQQPTVQQAHRTMLTDSSKRLLC